MLLNELTGEGQEINDDRLDVKDACSVLVKKELIVIKWGVPATAIKYTNFTDKD